MVIASGIRDLYTKLHSPCPRSGLDSVTNSPLLLIALTEAAAFLNDLDLVAVGIGDEEKARERRAGMLEIAQ